jgi:Bacterial DNA-binding protein
VDRVGLVKELATETGLKATDIKNVLNALVLLMNRDIQSGGSFEMPDVGVLTRGMATGAVLPAGIEKKPGSIAAQGGRGQIPPVAYVPYEGTFTPDVKAPKRRGQIPPPPR